MKRSAWDYLDNVDIYAKMASMYYKIPEAKVTQAQRRAVKRMVLRRIYGGNTTI